MSQPSKKDRWQPDDEGIRLKFYQVIFESNTLAGRVFDIGLLVIILLSILIIMLESVATLREQYGHIFLRCEWIITGVFTLEYFLRLWCCAKPKEYARSFFGLIDLLAVIPSYLVYFALSTQYFMVVRAFRLLRVFRILKMTRYLGEAETLLAALHTSRPKVTVFITSVLTVVVLVGTLMFLIEGPTHGFTSIPKSMYWAVVTLTTVGYGDIAPQTVSGQILATLLMICGYGLIAVPTGIVSVELARAVDSKMASSKCTNCGVAVLNAQSHFCHMCGNALSPRKPLANDRE